MHKQDAKHVHELDIQKLGAHLAQADDLFARSLSTRAALYARPRSQVARQAPAIVNGSLIVRHVPRSARIAAVRPMICHPEVNQTVTCPCCHQEMMFVRSIPKLELRPELRIFFCPSCGEAETQEVISAAA
jgi:hypothetical protein